MSKQQETVAIGPFSFSSKSRSGPEFVRRAATSQEEHRKLIPAIEAALDGSTSLHRARVVAVVQMGTLVAPGLVGCGADSEDPVHWILVEENAYMTFFGVEHTGLVDVKSWLFFSPGELQFAQALPRVLNQISELVPADWSFDWSEFCDYQAVLSRSLLGPSLRRIPGPGEPEKGPE